MDLVMCSTSRRHAFGVGSCDSADQASRIAPIRIGSAANFRTGRSAAYFDASDHRRKLHARNPLMSTRIAPKGLSITIYKTWNSSMKFQTPARKNTLTTAIGDILQETSGNSANLSMRPLLNSRNDAFLGMPVGSHRYRRPEGQRLPVK